MNDKARGLEDVSLDEAAEIVKGLLERRTRDLAEAEAEIAAFKEKINGSKPSLTFTEPMISAIAEYRIRVEQEEETCRPLLEKYDKYVESQTYGK